MLLVVSLDSENDVWLGQHMASGQLPNLAALAQAGRQLPVNAAALAGIAYPVLYSGLRATDAGHYFPLQWDPKQQCVVPAMQLHHPETVFTRLDRAGKRLILLDPPELSPLSLAHGYAVSGLQFRSRVLLHSWSSDPLVTRRLFQSLGPAPRADEIFGEVSAADLRYVRSALLTAPERLEKAALQLLRERQPDCLWLTCCALHIAGHQFSHLPMISDPALRAELEGTRLELARGYDRMLGNLLAALPPQSSTMVMYAKGMGRVTMWTDLLPNMLRAILGERAVQSPTSVLRSLLPRSTRRWVADRLSDTRALDLMALLSTPRADWSRTQAFCLPSDYPGFIRLNLQGRERDGIVKESARAALMEQIREGVLTFRDAEGATCAASVSTSEELLGPGSKAGDFPDLIVQWNLRPQAPHANAYSPRFGEVQRSRETVGRSGNHIPGAFAILPSGTQTDLMQVEDIPVTILEALGLEKRSLPGHSFWK